MRIGCLGTAAIVESALIEPVNACRTVMLGTIGSRNLTRAEEFADRFDFPKAVGSYEEVITDPEIDLVYIPLPIHLHAD